MRIALAVFIFLSYNSFAQTISGVVIDSLDRPIFSVGVGIEGTTKGTSTNSEGYFVLNYKGAFPIFLSFSHLNYEGVILKIDSLTNDLKVKLNSNERILDEINIQSISERKSAGLTTLSSNSIQNITTPGEDIAGLLKTLPGVVSNNEMSSSYSVRGGNFDENMVIVEGIPVYRPFLITNGQQEGLSFTNPDMINDLSFSSGGWEPKYGGKLSSVLKVNYKQEQGLKARAQAGLLGGRLYLGGGNQKVSYNLGIRRKSVGYLLNTFDTQGEYLPRFTDFQGLVNINFSPNTSLKFLTYYGRNRYFVKPENRVTEFGAFSAQSFRLFVAFEGSELMNYDTFQQGFNFQHAISKNWQLSLVGSYVLTNEREFRNIEGGYRLCDLDNNLNSVNFNECNSIRGIGTNFNYSRNILNAGIADIWLNSSHEINKGDIQWGFNFRNTEIDDTIDEYSYLDSANFITDVSKLYSENALNHSTISGYIQHFIPLRNNFDLQYGLRFTNISLTDEFTIEPRLMLSIMPQFLKNTNINAAFGLYNQPPMYRELRKLDGTLNRNIKSQWSYNMIFGMKRDIVLYERPFLLSAEFYYKNMWNVIAYNIDNVRLRYFADNGTTAEVYGADFRFAGEFIRDTESWFSLGFLNAREDIEGDSKGFIRRPTDQRITFGAFFQDHFPNNPSMRVSLNLQFGSGLPFGPPNSLEFRNVFGGDLYRRVDVGFSKDWKVGSHRLTFTIEVLNLLGANNSITYTWISDLNRNQIAVPNGLSARFFNTKLLFIF